MVGAQILTKGDLPAFVGEDSIGWNARAKAQYAFMSIGGVKIGIVKTGLNPRAKPVHYVLEQGHNLKFYSW